VRGRSGNELDERRASSLARRLGLVAHAWWARLGCGACRCGLATEFGHDRITRCIAAETSFVGWAPIPAGMPHYLAMKYLARGWWQMIAEVVCSGWYCQPVSSPTEIPIRAASSKSATRALSSRSGQAG